MSGLFIFEHAKTNIQLTIQRSTDIFRFRSRNFYLSAIGEFARSHTHDMGNTALFNP